MFTSRTSRIAAGSLAIAIASLGAACSKSDTSSTTASGDKSTTTQASSGGASSGGGGGASTSTKDLCTQLTAEQLSTLLGAKFTGAKPMSASDRFRSSNTGPSCVYATSSGLGGVNAEYIDASSFQGLTTDPVTKPKALAGVGDEAFATYDQIDSSKVLRVIAKKGDQYLYVQIFAGASEDKAKELANKLLA